MIEMEYNYKKRKESLTLEKGEYKGYKFIAYNTRHDHPCAYIAIPPGHRYFEVKYLIIPFIDCHGGLTCSSHYNPDSRNNESDWFIGWDYDHLGDYTAADEYRGLANPSDRKYTTQDVLDDIYSVIDNLVEEDNKCSR